ncbi:hypothetical protein AB0K51_31485 [Kitasatospora sp. NPDC049285]|uniref:hypothetical protein n=1 Tax=Kitasatospora sp. NPDC049285 TaxID=3157096 RepID=UPI00344395A2
MRKPFAALVGALLLAGCGAAKAPPPPEASPLSDLVGGNGLYVSAQTFATVHSSASVTDTVYDELTLKMAGKPVPDPWKTPAGATAFSDFARQHPVWGPWFISMAEQATGKTSGLLNAQSVLPMFTEAGYFSEPGDKPADTAGETAETQAALQVLAGSGLHLPAHDAELADHWLLTQATQIQYPVQACNLAKTFSSLPAPTPPSVAAYADNWMASHPTTGLKDITALADTYGATCAGKPSDETRRQLTTALAPYIDRPGQSTSLQRYQLTQTWLALGNDASRLTALSAVAQSDLDSRGLARGKSTLSGGLLPTYFATTIEQRLGHGTNPANETAVSKALASVNPGTDPIDYLAATATLCEIRACHVDQSAVSKAVSALPRHIGQDDVETYVDAAEILGTLRMKYPAVTIDDFDKSTDMGFFGLLLLARAGSDAADKQLSTAEITAAWRAHGDSWGLREINAMVLLLQSRHSLNPEMSGAIRERYDRSRGCAGLSVLYATDASSTDPGCDLSTTLDAIEAVGYVSPSI